MKKGRIEVITGGMSAGKTEELMRRLNGASFAKLKVQIFKPVSNIRSRKEMISSHDGRTLEAIPVKSAKEILESVQTDTRVVAIDDGHFLDPEIVKVCESLADDGKRVIIAGLDMDFQRKPFGSMPFLMAIADDVKKLHAVCEVCGEDASFSQRLINGKSADYDSPGGAGDFYEPRCRLHYVRSRPNMGPRKK